MFRIASRKSKDYECRCGSRAATSSQRHASIWRWADRNAMTTRTTSTIVTFARPFTLKGVDRILPAGNYRVVTDEELIEELSFPVYRRISTMIFVPAVSASSVEMVTIDPQDLQAAQERDLKRGA
jgi:hypothetical protein